MAGTPGNSGGRRQGRPGRKYVQRTDLRQPPKAVQGQTYGDAGKQLAAQKALPLGTGPGAPAPSSGTAALAGAVGGGSNPIVPLGAPSARPNEPLTHGLPSGPGAGPEALGLPNPQNAQDDAVLSTLRGLYQAFPNSDLARLIAKAEQR